MARKNKRDPLGLEGSLAKQAEGFAQTFQPGAERTAFAWVACDASDEIALFWPCEFGPVPSAVQQFPLDEHLAWCRYLYTLEAGMAAGDHQIDLPQLGFYFYSLENHQGYSCDGYQRLSTPSQPKTVEALPAQFHPLLRAIRLPGKFRETPVVFAARLWPTV